MCSCVCSEGLAPGKVLTVARCDRRLIIVTLLCVRLDVQEDQSELRNWCSVLSLPATQHNGLTHTDTHSSAAAAQVGLADGKVIFAGFMSAF